MSKTSKIVISSLVALGFLAGQLLACTNTVMAYERPDPYFHVVLVAPTNNPTRVLHAQVITSELWKIGIDAELLLTGWDVLIRRMFYSRNFETYAGDGFDIGFVGWSPAWSVTESFQSYHSALIDKVAGRSNFYPINNSRLDALINKITTTMNLDQRRLYTRQALNIIVWEVHPVTGLYQPGQVVAQDSAIRNLANDFTGIFVSWPEAYFENDKQSELVAAISRRFSGLLFGNSLIDGCFNRPTGSHLYEFRPDGMIHPVLAAADPIPLSSADPISQYIDVSQISPDSPYYGATATTLWGPNPNIDAAQYNANVTAANHSMFLIPMREGIPWQPGYGYTADMKLNATSDDLLWTWKYQTNDDLPPGAIFEPVWGADITNAFEKVNATMLKANFAGLAGDGIAGEWFNELVEAGGFLPRHILDPTFDATPYGGAVGVTPDGTRILPYAEQDRYRRHTGEGDRPIIGTGPYYLERWDEIQQFATYRKFNDWGGYGNKSLWNDPRYQLNNIEILGITVIPTKDQAIIALENEDVDVINQLPGYILNSDVQYLRNRPNIQVDMYLSGGIQFMGYNTLHPKLNNRYVRLAISHLVPRERFVTYLLNSIGAANEFVGLSVESPYYPSEEEWATLGLPISENVVDPETNETLEFQGHIRYNVAKAQALMEKAGYDMNTFREAVRLEGEGASPSQDIEPLPLLLASGVIIAIVGAILVLSRRYWQQYLLTKDPPALRLSRQRKQLLDAIQLKRSPRLSEKAQAQDIFQQLAKAEVLVPELSIYSMLNLCDLLMDEVRAYGEQAVLDEAQKLSNRIYDIAHNQGSSSVLVEALLLQSKFALLEGSITRADKLLTQAATVATGRQIPKLAQKVAHEQSVMEKEYSRWEQLITDASPIRERLEQARLQDYIASAVQVIEQEEAIADLADAGGGTT
ncbi:MAG: ABC transporter substrate-binding protein [Candidatus Heimdallarchaeota archaeon]